jgi:hypothetical protein
MINNKNKKFLAGCGIQLSTMLGAAWRGGKVHAQHVSHGSSMLLHMHPALNQSPCLELVPCGIYITLTSSHVNMSDHNPKHLYGIYERIRKNNPCSWRALTLQLLIVEVWLYIRIYNMKTNKIASIDCISWLQRVKELQVPADKQFYKKNHTRAVHILHGMLRRKCPLSFICSPFISYHYILFRHH